MTPNPNRKRPDEKREALKRGGWRRQDFASLGERWFGPGANPSLGVSLDVAWRRYKASLT